MLSSYCQSSGRHMQRCERTVRVGSREGADGLCHTSAVVMAEGGGACLLTVAVRLLFGIETAQHVLACACSVLRSYSHSSGRTMQRCERTARVASREG